MSRLIRIAVCGPMSGPRKAYGEMLIEESNVLKSNFVHLDYFDDMAQADQAIKIAGEIVSQQYDLVIGHFNSYCSMAVKDIYKTAKIGFISPLSTHPELRLETGGAIFSPSDKNQVRLVVDAALTNSRAIYALNDGSEYGKRLTDLLMAEYKLVQVRQSTEKFAEGKTDQILIFLSGAHCNILDFHKELREVAPNLMIVCCDDCYIEEYQESIKAIANDNDYLIGQPNGHRGSLITSLEYLKHLICHIGSDDILYDFVGKNIDHYQFLDDGRIESQGFELIPINTF